MAGNRIALITNYMVVEYFSQILRGAREVAKKNRDKLVCISVGEFDLPENKTNKRSEIIKLINKELIDGLIINEGPFFNLSPPENFPELIERFYSLPAVGLGTKFSRLPHIYLDNEKGIDILFEHLIEHGCRRIAFISGPELNKDSQERTIAYLRNLKDHGFTILEHYLQHTDFYPAYVDRCLEDMLKHKDQLPDAIMCANDVIAENTILALRELGFAVPEDIKVTGFDNSSFALENEITTISMQRNEQGSEAVKTLDKMLQKEKVKLYNKIPVKLIPRKSCGCRVLNHSGDFALSYYKQIASLKHLALKIHRTGQNLNSAKNLDELKILLQESFNWIGVNDCAIYLLSSFEEEKGSLYFTQGILSPLAEYENPETYRDFIEALYQAVPDGELIILLPLFSKNLYLGILALCKPVHDLVLYENLSLQISEAIHTVRQLGNIQENLSHIKKSLKEKELLLKEVHHRVKNNLQIITSLINLKTRNRHDRNMDEIVTDLQASISSIALVHETIYQKSNYESISLHGYIRSLFSTIYQIKTFINKVDILVEGTDSQMNLQRSINCGLVLSELFINTFKHAYNLNGGCPQKLITFSSEKTGRNKLKITYRDNGIGFDPEPAADSSFGLTIISSLVRDQLNGKFTNKSKKGKGACYIIEIETDD